MLVEFGTGGETLGGGEGCPGFADDMLIELPPPASAGADLPDNRVEPELPLPSPAACATNITLRPAPAAQPPTARTPAPIAPTAVPTVPAVEIRSPPLN